MKQFEFEIQNLKKKVKDVLNRTVSMRVYYNKVSRLY